MDSEHVIALKVNRNTPNIEVHLRNVYHEILSILYQHRDTTILVNNDDWLWLIDHWAGFYLSGTFQQVPSQSLFERLFTQIKVWSKIKSPSREIFYSVDAGYLKKLGNEMSDGKFLLVNGRKVPVEVIN